MKQKVELISQVNTLDQISVLLKKENQRKQKKITLLPQEKRNPRTKTDAIVLLESCSSFVHQANSADTTCDQHEPDKSHDGTSIYSPIPYWQQKNLNDSSSSLHDIDYYKYYEEDYIRDATYRLRMSSWSYRILDYFGASREIATIAFNYLDRFIDSGVYCCQSAYSYKLASITALHIALKVHNRSTIKATTLADLSKGEISPADIIHMESIMLKALDYHLCPPTCQMFIVLFAELLPVSVRESSIVSHIINQAMYIVELSTMHLLMKGVKASVVSVGAMLKVMDRIMASETTVLNGNDIRLAFIENVVKLVVRRPYNAQHHHSLIMTKQAGQEQVPSSSNTDDADVPKSWLDEVQCCRVLLDEIVTLNCRQAMDESDQILPCKRTKIDYNKKSLPCPRAGMISGNDNTLIHCNTSENYGSQDIITAHHVFDQRDDCEEVRSSW